MSHSNREEKIEEVIRNAAAEFLQRESNRLSLITVTRVIMFDKLTKATVLMTVLPENRQDEAVEFAQRNRQDFKEYLKGHTRLQRLPSVNFQIDFGEKNRQRIDEISGSISM
ncbi:MAG: ribosome-binding factor A [bacterium]|nr:ribosome-binding factor A [bacterium]